MTIYWLSWGQALCMANTTSNPPDRWRYHITPVFQMRNMGLREVSYPRDKELSTERQTSPAATGCCWATTFQNSVVLSHRAKMLLSGRVEEDGEARMSEHTQGNREVWGGGIPSQPYSSPTWKRTILPLPQAWASCQRWALIKALGLLLEFLCSRTHPIRKRSHIFGPF